MFDTIAQNYGVAPPKAAANAIDPATGKPYVFSTNGSGGENVWTLNGTNLSGANAQGLGGYSGTEGGGANVSNITPMGLNQMDWLKSIGYQTDPNDIYGGTQSYNQDTGSIDSTGKVEQYLQSQGITLAEKSGESNGQNRVFQAFKNGQPIGQSFKVKDNEDAFGLMVAAAAAIATAGVATAGVAGAEGGAAAVDGAGGIGLAEGATPASLSGGEIGGGLSASSFEAPTAIAGDSAAAASPTNAALIDSYAGTPGYGVSSAGGGGVGGVSTGAAGTGLTTGQIGSGVSAAGGAGGLGSSSATTPALIDSAAGTPGYGGSSAGVGGGVGNLTGIAGPTAGAGSSWLDMLKAGDVTGAIQSGGSSVLDFLKTPGGLSLLGGIANGLIGSNAASNASDQIAKSAAAANALQKYMYDTTRADQAPYRATGVVGSTGMTNLLSDPSAITKDPSYGFGLDQGTRAIQNNAGAKGGYYSGATLKALERYGQDYGSTKLNDAFGRYSTAANLGESATTGTSAAGANYANKAGDNLTGAGSAAGAASLYSGNVWQQNINNALAQLNRSTYQPATPGP